jgi:hypothetical protein
MTKQYNFALCVFIGLLEIPFLLKLAKGSIDCTSYLGFGPLCLKNDEEEISKNQIKEIKYCCLTQLAIGDITHHYFKASFHRQGPHRVHHPDP